MEIAVGLLETKYNQRARGEPSMQIFLEMEPRVPLQQSYQH
jgi:hypothetical protein